MAEVYFRPPASATPIDRQALRDGWIRLLERWEWEWFSTFTFRDLVHPEAADKRFRVLISKGYVQFSRSCWPWRGLSCRRFCLSLLLRLLLLPLLHHAGTALRQ